MKLNSICTAEDFLHAALIKVSSPLCSSDRKRELVPFVADKYKLLPDNFNFKSICSNDLNVTEFYELYVKKIMLKEGNVSWHPNLLKHVVHLDQVYLFAQNAIDHVEFDVEDKGKISKVLAHCSSNSKQDRKTHPLAKIMTAIKSKFTKITDQILRFALRKPNVFCREAMLDALNKGDEQFQLLAMELIHRVLTPQGDYTTNFQRIYSICIDYCFIVRALNSRFKRAKAAKVCVPWTLDELTNFMSNNSERNQAELFIEIADLTKKLNCNYSLEETK